MLIYHQNLKHLTNNCTTLFWISLSARPKSPRELVHFGLPARIKISEKNLHVDTCFTCVLKFHLSCLCYAYLQYTLIYCVSGNKLNFSNICFLKFSLQNKCLFCSGTNWQPTGKSPRIQYSPNRSLGAPQC